MASAGTALRTQHDAFVRYVFGRPGAAAIVLRHVLPAALLSELALESLTRQPAAYTRPGRGPLDSDLLFEVDLRETGEPEPCSVHVMLDHQSSLDELFAWRAHVYAGELWGRHIDAQPRRPRRLPFILPVVLLQHPARNTPIRLSDILQLPARVRPIFGAPFEVELYIDDLGTPILHDSEADAGHLALVEITRALLHAHKNQTPQTEQRLTQLGPLFDTVLVQFGSSNIKEILSYVVNVFGTSSAIYDTLMGVISQGVREMHRTVADDLRDEGRIEGRIEGRVAARAEALFGVLSHRAWSIPGALRERILDTADEHLLQRWFDRAFTARSIDEVFQPLDA